MMNLLLAAMIVIFGFSVATWAQVGSGKSINLPAALPAKKVQSQLVPATDQSQLATNETVVILADSSTGTAKDTLGGSVENQTVDESGKQTSLGVDPNLAKSSVPARQDLCMDTLPQVESSYRSLEQKYQQIELLQRQSYENYTGSFSKMTDVLFELTDQKEQETKKILESRDLLKNAVEIFNENRSSDNTQKLQKQYMDLTMHLYTAVNDGQKILETLKNQLGNVEANRNEYEKSKMAFEQVDQERLALEGKYISLKIRCQADAY